VIKERKKEKRKQQHIVLQLLVTANVPSSLIPVTLMMGVIRSSATSVLTRATRCNIPEDDILHRHHRENLKPYNAFLSLLILFTDDRRDMFLRNVGSNNSHKPSHLRTEHSSQSPP
jgi:hypothetical protein